MLLTELKAFIKANRKKGRREAFGLAVQNDDTYLTWAFAFDYLFVVKDKDAVKGCGVAYPLPQPYTGSVSSLYSFGTPVPRDQEESKQLCIMDWVAVDAESRRSLVKQFKARFPSWQKQRKLGIQFDDVRELSNKYLNYLETL
jgi:hypothetical protein